MSTDPLDKVKQFFGESPDPVPRRVGRYEIIRELGRGGMAVVYEALDPDLGRKVALKVLKEGSLARLRREAMAAAKLRHPNVVAVHEVGPDFIVMDLVEGRTLAEALPGLAIPDRLRILHAVAGAVAAAHEQGVVHRDLKATNVLLDRAGRPVLTDFGLATIEGGEDLTRTGSVAGTPHSMAPEQVRGESGRIGPPADVWALGVLLYEMVSNRKPFDGETPFAIYERITRDDPPRLAGEAGTIAQKALEKDPGHRYPQAGAFAEDLRRLLEGEPLGARPAGLLERGWKKIRRKPAVYALGLGALLAGATAVALGFAGHRERGRALEALRQQARVSLEAALELRRSGANARMRQFLPPLESAYRNALEHGTTAEVDYLMGRMDRALLEEAKAGEFQDRALSKEARYAPALYERAVLGLMAVGRRLKGAEEDGTPRKSPELDRMNERILRDCDDFLASGVPSATVGVSPASAVLIRGLRAYLRGEFADARVRLEEAMKLDPFLEEARETLTQVVREEILSGEEDRERRWRLAEELYTQGLARDRGYLPHLLGRGELRWSRGSARRHRGLDPMPDYGSAADDFTEAIRLAPESADARAWRGQVRTYHAIWKIETGQDPRADCTAAGEDLTKAIALDPSHSRAWMWRGNARFYLATWLAERREDPLPDFEAAEKDLTEAVRVAKDFPDPLKWRGRLRAQHAAALGRHGRDASALFESAEQDFVRSEKVLRGDTWMWLWRSTAWSERGLYRISKGEDPRPDFAKAEEQLNEVLRLNRHQMEGWKHRGFLRWHAARHLESVGDKVGARKSYEGAEADFLEALSTNPTLKHQIGDRMERARQKVAELGN